MSPDFLEQGQSGKLPRLHDLVRNAAAESPLYREKYNAYDLGADFTGTFKKLPLLSRQEYYQGMKPPHFPLLRGGLQHCYIFTSGGTSGDVKLTAWSLDFVNNWTDECFRSLTAVGLAAGDVVVNLFFPGIWATHTLINKALEKADCRIIPLGGKVPLPLLATYLSTFRVNTLIGVPSFIVRLTEYLESLPASRRPGIKIEKVYHAGEFLSPRQATFIQERLHCRIAPFLYSSTDTGTIGMKCPHMETNQYHLADSLYLETLDLESNQPVPAGTPGEFIVTSLVNKKAPCIRYRVGDQGIVNPTSEPCPCGNPSPLFTLLGRADDEVKVAGYLISPEIFQQGLEKFPELSRNFQLIVREHGQKTQLTVACETVPSVSLTEHADLPGQIADSLVKHYDILEVLIRQQYCLPLEIRLLAPGTLPRNPQTGKIKRVLEVT